MKIDRNVLSKGLNIVSKVVPSKTPLPVIMNILLKARENELVLQSTNLEMNVKASIPVIEGDNFSAVIPAKTLVEAVGLLNGSEINFSYDKGTLKIGCGKYNGKINGAVVADFPDITRESKKSGRIGIVDFRELVTQTSYASSEDKNRPIFTGTHVLSKENEISFATTDSLRFAHFRKEIPFYEVETIVPTEALKEVLRIANSINAEELSVSVNPGNIVFSFSGDSISVVVDSLILEGTFPNLMSIVPTDFETGIRTRTKDLINACKQALIIAKNEIKSIRFDISDKVFITANSMELGSVETEVEAVIDGSPIRFGINVDYTLDALNAISTADVDVEIKGNRSPIMFKPTSNDDIIHIVMPMMIG